MQYTAERVELSRAILKILLASKRLTKPHNAAVHQNYNADTDTEGCGLYFWKNHDFHRSSL